MTDKDIHKFYKFLKGFPEHHSLMKNLLIDYINLRDENKKLVEVNLELIDDLKQYKNLIEEQQNIDFVIH
jgi:6-phosphogluconolactonase/glucosamine-6-phosphate isomerase/deaminase